MTAAYRKHAPHKLSEVKELLQKYKNHEKAWHDAFITKHEGSAKAKDYHADRVELNPWQCRLCLQMGHYGGECPMRRATKSKAWSGKQEVKEEPTEEANEASAPPGEAHAPPPTPPAAAARRNAGRPVAPRASTASGLIVTTDAVIAERTQP